jgi:hypothetical protein
LFLASMPYIPQKTVAQIIESGNHYLIQVKGNQSALQTAIIGECQKLLMTTDI